MRARRDDIPMLVEHILRASGGDETLKVSPDTMQALMAHDWPGNIRELRNVLERAVISSQGGHYPTMNDDQLTFLTEELTRLAPSRCSSRHSASSRAGSRWRSPQAWPPSTR